MSVINKMLNDLEHRQSEQSLDGIDSKYRPPEKKVLTSKQMVAIGAVVVIVIFVGLAAWFSFNYFSNQSDSSNTTKIPNSSDRQVQDSPTKAATIVRNPSQFEQKEQAIQKLMDAESKKQQVSSSFDNVANSNSSPVMQESVTPVVSPPETVKTVTVAKKPMSNLPKARTQPEQEKPKPKPKASNSERSAVPQFKIEKSSTTLTAQQRIDSWMTKAKESFEKGYITDAVENLNKILALSDSHVEARNLLAAAWYGRGDPKRAVGIINDGLNRYPNKSEWRLTAAKIFFKENNKEGALSYLNANLTEASVEYFSMKANLARELQQWELAESAYLMLTRKQADLGNWWLGYGISLDSQEKHEQAIFSYKTALAKGKISKASVEFVKSRIEELESNGGS